jgi:hypothetical protein
MELKNALSFSNIYLFSFKIYVAIRGRPPGRRQGAFKAARSLEAEQSREKGKAL